MNGRPSFKPALALIASVLCWSTVPVFIRYLSDNLGTGLSGNFTQNLYRYLPACLLLWTLSATLFRKHLAIPRRRLIGLFWPMLIICCHQLAWVAGITMTTPTTAALLSELQVVVVGLLALLFFHDERSTIRGGRFLIGSALSLAGVLGFIYFSGGHVAGSTTGYLIALLAAVFWGIYTVTVKVTTRGLHPVVSFSWVSTGALVFFILTTPHLGEPGMVLRTSGWVVAALGVSGVIGIAMAHMFFYRALAGLGAAVCGTVVLSVPLFTGIWSFIFYRETFTPLQFLSGTLILAGALLVVRQTPPPEPID